MNPNRKKAIIIYVVVTFIIVVIAFALLNASKSDQGVEKVEYLDNGEYLAICDEYCLDPEKIRLDYIFLAGGNTYGARIWLEDESVLENMNVLFDGDMLADDNYFNLVESGGKARMSDQIQRDVARPQLSDTIKEKHGGEPVYCFVYRDDKGMYYMEMMTLATENEAIYRKNEK
ncbi:MAG: hypothetical protein HDT24_10470 [Ruminococcus sp.]|nr:hypothetical protein [Ruminococcus sp.]